MAQSPNLALPFISASQAQKHVTHNEAIAALDTIVQLSVVSATETTPPIGAPEGARYVVPSGATGAWAGHTGEIAQQEIGGWRFVPPSTGLRAWIDDQSVLAVFDGTNWIDFRSTLTELSLQELGINATADATNRLSLASPASLFNHEGSSHRLTVNKNAAGDTASLVFQNGFSGRAELGLAGSDNLSMKVSANGSSWHDALACDRNTGALRAPAGIAAPGLPIRVETAVLATGFSTTSTTPQNTGLSLTITPKTNSSKLLVRCNLIVGGYFWTSTPLVTVTRNGTKIWPSGSGVSMANQIISGTLANTRLLTYPASFEFLDAPATASAVTYQVMLCSSLSGANSHLNVRDSDLALRGESSMTVTEISG